MKHVVVIRARDLPHVAVLAFFPVEDFNDVKLGFGTPQPDGTYALTVQAESRTSLEQAVFTLVSLAKQQRAYVRDYSVEG